MIRNHRYEKIHGMPGTSLEPPGIPRIPWARPWDPWGRPWHPQARSWDPPGRTLGPPRGPPRTPYGLQKLSYPSDIQRQKLSIAVFEPVRWDPSPEGLPRTILSIKRPSKKKSTTQSQDFPQEGMAKARFMRRAYT